jgi:hypothetical protein
MNENISMTDYDSDLTDLAYQVWERMQPQIRKIATKVAGFSDMYDPDELTYGLAYEAIHKGCCLFNRFRKMATVLSNNHKEDIRCCLEALKGLSHTMRIETFCYWYLMKVFFKEAGTNEVCYVVVSPQGKVETYINGEFRKKFNKAKIKAMEQQGYRFITDRVFKVFSDLCKEGKDGNDMEFDIANVDGLDEEFTREYGNGRRVIWWG